MIFVILVILHTRSGGVHGEATAITNMGSS